MKKLVGIFVFIILFLFINICIMVGIDKSNINSMKENILKNTDIDNVDYVNYYDNYYIVKNDKYVYLLDLEYKELYKIEVYLLHDNNKEYDLIYKDDMLMYMDNYKNEERIVFKYYDIRTYELIDELTIGGNYE